MRSRPQQQVNLLPSRILQRVLLLLCPFSGCTGTGPGADDSGGVLPDTGASSLDDTGGFDSTVGGVDSVDSTSDSGPDTAPDTGDDTSGSDSGIETGSDDTSTEDTGVSFDAIIYGVTENEQVGSVAYPAGDVNGDGLKDMWIGKSSWLS